MIAGAPRELVVHGSPAPAPASRARTRATSRTRAARALDRPRGSRRAADCGAPTSRRRRASDRAKSRAAGASARERRRCRAGRRRARRRTAARRPSRRARPAGPRRARRHGSSRRARAPARRASARATETARRDAPPAARSEAARSRTQSASANTTAEHIARRPTHRDDTPWRAARLATTSTLRGYPRSSSLRRSRRPPAGDSQEDVRLPRPAFAALWAFAIYTGSLVLVIIVGVLTAVARRRSCLRRSA